MSIYTGTPGNVSYYRIMKFHNSMTISVRQDFDEVDYNQDDTVKNEEGEPYYFLSKNTAIEYLNKWYPQKLIDPEYKMDKNFSLTKRADYNINKDKNNENKEEEEEKNEEEEEEEKNEENEEEEEKQEEQEEE